MKNFVYVKDINGRKLTPTTNIKYAWFLIRKGRAKIIKHKPLEIMLLKKVKEEIKGKGLLGIDLGGTFSSITVINNSDEKVKILYSDELEMRNKEVKDNIKERKIHKSERNRNNRHKKIRRAKKCKTIFKNAKNILFGTAKETSPVKYIKNQKVRFNNRKPSRYKLVEGNLIVSKDKDAVFLPPTIRHLIETEIKHFRKIYNLLPITDVIVEYTKFDTQKLDNKNIKGVEYQNGEKKGYDSDFDYINDIQEGKCLFCDKSITNIHHRRAKFEDGSERIINKVGLCKNHHDLIHKNKALYKSLIKKVKDYKQTAWINIATPFIYEGIKQICNNVSKTYGNVTYNTRKVLNLSKNHYTDSFCISVSKLDKENIKISNINDLDKNFFSIKQYKVNNNRAIRYSVTDRKYTTSIEYQINDIKGRETKKKELVLINRNKKTEQEADSLSDFRRKLRTVVESKSIGKVMKGLKITKGTVRYNSKKVFNPGSIAKFKGKTYIVQGNVTNGLYLRFFGCDKQNFPTSQCKLIKKTTNFVYQ